MPVTCGSLECEVKFSLYKYKDDPQINQPLIWNRSDDEEEESDDGESSLIQVSGKMKVKNLTKKTKEDWHVIIYILQSLIMLNQDV